MKNSHIVFLINDDVRAIRAKYEEGGKPEIFKTMDPSIGVDDLLVVESGTRHYVTTVKVTEVDVDVDFDDGPEIKWVVQRINMEDHVRLVAHERKAIDTAQSAEKRRRKEELRAAMFKDHEDKMKSLQLANHSGDDEVTE